MKRILAALVLFSIAAAIVTCFGSRPADAERIMATKSHRRAISRTHCTKVAPA